MNEKRLEIARRLVACKGWVWLPGMLRRDPRHPETWQRIISVSDLSPAGNVRISAVCVARCVTGELLLPMVYDWVESAGDCDHLPDLSDDLTRLGVLALVRRAHQDESVGITKAGDEWAVTMAYVEIVSGDARMAILRRGPTELEALLSTLEAAP